ncbi:hypothetical protein Ddye_023366 [Dipteronia dyeriana]|uniref:Uncharacterized protein n=1 Tax=Dipteronia dyeriana TaxID=168575 RepID=A0AAD9TTT7_9ROSI|nr:hypothetical protein Ddye_023366 [Dipteronia dyeriana]
MSYAAHNFIKILETEPQLQLIVLHFLPILAGVYLSRVTLRKPLAGFEALLLALYAHETTYRLGQSLTMNVPDLLHLSIYHKSKTTLKSSDETDLNLVVISPILEPHGTTICDQNTLSSTYPGKIVCMCGMKITCKCDHHAYFHIGPTSHNTKQLKTSKLNVLSILHSLAKHFDHEFTSLKMDKSFYLK